MAFTRDNNLVANIAAEATVNTDNYGNTIINYLDETGQTVSTLTVSSDGSSTTLGNNPNWSDPYALSMNKVKLLAMNGPNITVRDYLQMSPSGFWDRFTNCLRVGACQLTGGCGGGRLGTVAGYALMANAYAGPGALLGCTLHATFF